MEDNYDIERMEDDLRRKSFILVQAVLTNCQNLQNNFTKNMY